MPDKMREGLTPYFYALLKGLVICFALLIIASVVLGLLSSLDAIQEDLANKIMMIINYVAIFIGGIYVARLVDNRGWLNGGLTGLLYMLIIVIIGTQIVNVAFGLDVLLRIVSGFITGAIGGVVGVNLK